MSILNKMKNSVQGIIGKRRILNEKDTKENENIKDDDNKKAPELNINKRELTEKTLININDSEEEFQDNRKTNLYNYKIIKALEEAQLSPEDSAIIFNKYCTLNGSSYAKIASSKLSKEIKNSIFANAELGPNIEYAIFSENIDEKEKKIISSRISNEKLKKHLNKVYPFSYDDINVSTVSIVNKLINVTGVERAYEILENKELVDFNKSLYANFSDKEIVSILGQTPYVNNIEFNFCNKMREQDINYETNARTLIKEIFIKDGTLDNYRKYVDFRKGDTDLDASENLLNALFEYKKYGDLYKDISNNIENITPEELREIKIRYNGLMKRGNPFEIKTYDELMHLDDIEKKYYQEKIKQSDKISKQEIKELISEILVENRKIEEIVQLGNARDNKMKNKSTTNDIIELLSTINEIDDEEKLMSILKETVDLIGTQPLKDIRNNSQNIQEKLINEYRNEYASELTRYEKMSDDEIEKMEGISAKTIDGVRVIELKGIPFKHLIHTGRIDGADKRSCACYITDQEFSKYGGEIKFDPIFNEITASNIKVMCSGDVGFLSKYKNSKQYVSPEDLSAMTTKTDKGGVYNEVTLATGTTEVVENGSSKVLKPSAYITKEKVGTGEFDKRLQEAKEKGTPVIYVFDEEIYIEKQQKRDERKDEYLQKYLTTLDEQALNKVLLATHGEPEERKKIIENINNKLSSKTIEKTDKTILRSNIAKYNELANIGLNENGEKNQLREKLEERLRTLSKKELSEKGDLQKRIEKIAEHIKQVKKERYSITENDIEALAEEVNIEKIDKAKIEMNQDLQEQKEQEPIKQH